MSVFPELERELLAAAERRAGTMHAGSRLRLARARAPRAHRPSARRVRVALVALGCLLALTTVALAAGGVILTGVPVRPEEVLNPSVGLGLPAPGGSQLLGLRVVDPEGGLPWGMRIVRTTRGEVCVQIARVQGGALGALGIDGEFHGDGRFHPLAPDALPGDFFHGRAFDSMLGNANTTCALQGQATVSEHIGGDRGAGPNHHQLHRPLRDLRNLYFGLLGPQAVSVTYKTGNELRTVPVEPGLGAYLIVGRTHPGQLVESGDSSLGTEGDLAPSPPLTVITYRLAGKPCERVPSDPFAPRPHVANPCPWPRFRPSGRPRDLRLPLHVALRLEHGTLAGARLTFRAPFAITSARQHYVIAIPTGSCIRVRRLRRPHGAIGYTGETISENVRAGATLPVELSAPELFSTFCGERPVQRRTARVEVFYEQGPGLRTIVGAVTVRVPRGVRVPKAPALPRLTRRGGVRR